VGGPSAAATAHEGLDFAPVADAEQVRAEMAAFLDEHLTDEVLARAHDTGTVHDWGLHRALAEAGWLGAGWPEEVGGQGRDAFGLAAVQDELRLRGAPMDGWGTTELVAHVIDEAGTEQQKEQVIGPFLRGELLIALGYSEPEAGSDVASVATRAVRDEAAGEWVIDGQKMFTTLAHEAHLVFLLARTNKDVPKHRGLTLFLVPMDSPGIEVQPVPTLGGERTNITFYDGVRVPDSARVGEVDGGWDVMKVALAHERNPAMLAELERLLGRVEGWAVDTGAIEQDLVAERLGRAAVEVEVGRCLADRMTWITATGGLPISEGSMAKLYTSETFQSSAQELLDVLGVDGLRDRHDPDAPLGGWVEHAHRHAQVVTIYAGTSEIQRSIVAERHLGLPRAR
jgi:alkylation response protein AidB-like acyl-CoA dehydrogenase